MFDMNTSDLKTYEAVPKILTHEEELYIYRNISTKDFVIQSSSIEHAGRGVFSRRELKLGKELISSLEPFVSIVTKKKLSTVCHGCFRQSSSKELEGVGMHLRLKHCSGCKIVHYCSPTCQMEDWLFHRKECEIINTKYIYGISDLFRLMVRFLVKWRECISKNKQSNVNRLNLFIIQILKSCKPRDFE
jgi:hypothetical protein